MLSGIGGKTIAEAKANMTQAEAIQWSAYRRRRGSLHTGRRLEVGFGQVLEAIYRAMGSKDISAKDFMPHEFPREPEPEHYASLDQVLNLLQSTTRH